MSSLPDAGPEQQLAEALACKLTELGWPCQRSYQPTVDPKDTETVHIWTIGTGDDVSLAAKRLNQHDVQVTILVCKTLENPSDISEPESLAKTVEDIKRLWGNPAAGESDPIGTLRHARLAGLAWKGTLQNTPLFDPQRMHEFNQWVSVITLTYHGKR